MVNIDQVSYESPTISSLVISSFSISIVEIYITDSDEEVFPSITKMHGDVNT